MTRHPNNPGEKPRPGHGKTLLIATGMWFAVTLLLHWGWNTFAVEILSQKAMQIKHTLALESLLAALLVMVFALRQGRFYDHGEG